MIPNWISRKLRSLVRQRITYLVLIAGVSTTLLVSASVLLSGGLFAQTGNFDSRSDGSDGGLVLTEPGTIVFDPRNFNPPLDPDGDNVFHFTTIDIRPGVNVVLSSRVFDGPVYWLATGDVVIEGTIDLSGEGGYASGSGRASRQLSIPGPGGYPGGIGVLGSSPAQSGFGPGKGLVSQAMGWGLSAGYGTSGGGAFQGKTYGNEFLVPLLGGSGGAGTPWGNEGNGGGAGGGAFLVASSTLINLVGSISSDGGDGVNVFQVPGVSGAGSGGAIHLVAPEITGTGNLSALGGIVPAPPSFFGGKGRILVEDFQHEFAGVSDPVAILGSPFLILPQDVPEVRVVTIAGQIVPSFPTGDFVMPDTVFDHAGPVLVEIEAHNVAPGTVLEVRAYSENDVDLIVDSAPLAGTLERSTATADVTFPSGFSRILISTK